jgi:hypothetical protein
MDEGGTTWVDVAQIVAAVAGLGVAGLVAFMPYARRPRLSVTEDAERVQSRVEQIRAEQVDIGDIPHVRLLVGNKRGRRAAQATRVLVEWYQPRGGRKESLAHPSLAWPSTTEAEATGSVVVFAGGHRPVSLARLIRVRLDDDGNISRPERWVTTPGGLGLSRFPQGPNTLVLTPLSFPHFPDGEAEGWYLFLAELDVNDDRDKLPPVEGGYTIRLLVGADDGAARAFEVDISWDGNPALTPEEVLASALDRLAVREV